MDHAKNALVYWRFRERQEDDFIDRRSGSLCAGIEFPDRLDFIAEEFNAQGTIRLGRISVENPATQRKLPRHVDGIGRVIADCAEMLD